MKLARVFYCLLAPAVALTGCERKPFRATASLPHLIKIVLQCDDVPRAESGGYYQALAKGFYRKAGLEVEILPRAGDTDPRTSVAEGRAEFGLARSDDVLVAASRRLPLQMVAAMRQHDPLVLLVHEHGPVRKFADLNGANILADEGPAWAAGLQKRHHISFTLKPAAQPMEKFIASEDAVLPGYATSDIYHARQRRVEVRALPLADAEDDAYHMLFCRRVWAQQNPRLVRAFVAATLRGWLDFLDGDPAPAYELMLRRNPQLDRARLEYARGELILGGYITGDGAKGEFPGAISLDRLGRELDRLLELRVIEAPVSINAVATKEYLPPGGP